MTTLTDPKLAQLVSRYREWVAAENQPTRERQQRAVNERRERQDDYRRQREEYEEKKKSTEVVEATQQCEELQEAISQKQDTEDELDRLRKQTLRSYQRLPAWRRLITRRPDTISLEARIATLRQARMGLEEQRSEVSSRISSLLPDYPVAPYTYSGGYEEEYNYLQTTYQGFLDWCVREGFEVAEGEDGK